MEAFLFTAYNAFQSVYDKATLPFQIFGHIFLDPPVYKFAAQGINSLLLDKFVHACFTI